MNWELVFLFGPTVLFYLVLLIVFFGSPSDLNYDNSNYDDSGLDSGLDSSIDKGELIIGIIISFVPVINVLLLIFILVVAFNEIVILRLKNKKNKKSKLSEYNKFIECSECGVYMRKGYILMHNIEKKKHQDSSCPICNELMTNQKEVKVHVNYPLPLAEQIKFTNFKSFEKNLVNKKGELFEKEQNKLYLAAKEKKIRRENDEV